MRVRMFCDDREAFVSSFVGKFTGSVCKAVTESLKAPTCLKHIQFVLEGERVRLHVNGVPVEMDTSQGFAETIVRDTIRGMIRHLKGIDPTGSIRIEVELEGSRDESQI